MSRVSSRVTAVATVAGGGFALVLLAIIAVGLWSDGVNPRMDGAVVEAAGFLELSTLEGQSVPSPLMASSPGIPNFTRKTRVRSEQDVNDVSSNLVLGSETSRSVETTSAENLIREKKDREFVRLYKISQNQYEDPPEGANSAKRHHSGHFRHASAQIWDPHPQYEFTAFDRRFHLRLAHDAGFVSPDVKVTRLSENSTKREHPGHRLGCFYSGHVDGDATSTVTVSLCDGMTGYIRTSTGSYHIKPAEQWRNADESSIGSPLQHAIYRVSAIRTDTNNVDHTPRHNCGVIDYDNEDVSSSAEDTEHTIEGSRRRRRSVIYKTSSISSQSHIDFDRSEDNVAESDEDFYDSYRGADRKRIEGHSEFLEGDPFTSWRPRRALPREYFIEIMVVADAKMVDYHGHGLFNYILVLMSTVSRIYKDQSIGNPITIAVIKIVETDDVFGVRHPGSDGIAAQEMLRKFCYWQKKNNPHEPAVEHHDVALLLTRENLCHNPEQMRCDTLGLAELGKMCSPSSSCAIVQDNGLAAAFTIAHEIGHVINMPHDDDAKCLGFRNNSKVHNVMSRMLDDNTFPWEWSKCSRHYATEFLESGRANCLLDEPGKSLERTGVVRLPGEDYSENRQCELVFGPGSKICPHMAVCKRLWCTAPLWDHQQQCHTQHMPWADGTSCGRGKWCQRGECVSRRSLEPIDGQWGDWSKYGECSRSCGGGIKKKYRECNNPPPENGGNYCVGDHVKYRSCNTKECAPGAPDFREEQCAKFDNNNLNIQNLASDVKWRAKYTRILPQDRCKLFCQVESNQYYELPDKVIDGTACGPDTFHVCVNGHCKPAGCDHILNSTAELDTCGVCGGDNSTCQKITGAYNYSSYGYTRVAKIPAGSSYIDIRQHSWGSSNNDSNYLALRLGEGGSYILNGNFMVMHRKVIVRPGLTIEYNGPQSTVERLNSSRPISTDLVLEVLSVGNVNPPQIMYEYTVPKRILNSYRWVLSNWTNCNRMCQGVKIKKPECTNEENNDKVTDDYCKEEEKPQQETQSCNGHCVLEWRIISKSDCSIHCGIGVRNVTSRCYQTLSSDFKSNHSRQVPPHVCSHLERPREQEACVGRCNDTYWLYKEWGACSVTCGGGVQFRTAICVDSNKRPLPDGKCNVAERISKRLCGQNSCPKWNYGDWTPCSVTCGIGKRKRRHWCQIDNRVISERYCNSLPSAGVTEICNAGPCYKWYASEWGPCSKTCGGGYMKRTVRCASSTNAESTDNFCIAKDKPTSVTNCNLHTCPTWNLGIWSQCNASCGNGVQVRQVRCVSRESNEMFPDRACHNEIKPTLKRECRKRSCLSKAEDTNHLIQTEDNNVDYAWKVANWTPCSAYCGNGTQSRTVKCYRVNKYGWIDPMPTDGCPFDQKPNDEQPCMQRGCNDTYYWMPGPWRKCTHHCGRKGKQTRRLFCRDINGKKTKRSNCPMSLKPERKRKCNQRRCGPQTCQEAKKRYKTTSDGEYQLLIGGKKMSIYCHNMNSREPREYLTLIVGEEENYSEIYNKRLMDPLSCPSNGLRDEHCQCFNESEKISGKTSFTRIRIDPFTLHIIDNDYTFSRTSGARRVEFGKAGDCYSRANCPQGRFSVNLSGTHLRLAPEVKWSPENNVTFLTIKKINGQRMMGKCGGYCGFCSAKMGLKLDVLPP